MRMQLKRPKKDGFSFIKAASISDDRPAKGICVENKSKIRFCRGGNYKRLQIGPTTEEEQF